MLDNKTIDEIVKHLKKIRFGKVTIQLMENCDYVTITTKSSKRIMKKNIFHKG